MKFHLFLYPSLFLFLFLVDKIFLLDVVRDHFIQPGGMLYYRQRKEQLEILKEFEKTRQEQIKLIIVLGDSRSFGLGMEIAKYLNYNDLSIWNFSGPQAVPAYYYYIASKILDFSKPQYFYIGVSPDAFNRNTGIFGSPVLIFGVDENFIKEYYHLIPKKDLETYQKSKIYALLGLQFSFKTLLKRIKGSFFSENLQNYLKKYNLEYHLLSEEEKKIFQILYSFYEENLSFYNYYKSPQRMLLHYTQGAQYAWFGKMSDKDLKKETEALYNFYIKNFTISYEQFIFFDFLLEKIKTNQTKAILYFPRVNPYLRKIYQDSKEIQLVQNSIQSIAKKYQFSVLDLNQDIISCNDFYDASHLSVSCFPEILKILVKNHK